MKFWDASALFSLFVVESRSKAMQKLFASGSHAFWWGTPMECESAICRRLREGNLSPDEATDVRSELATSFTRMIEVSPSNDLREIALTLLQRYPLRAADAAQLAAAELWRVRSHQKIDFVCLDQKLREAATAHGFKVLPS